MSLAPKHRPLDLTDAALYAHVLKAGDLALAAAHGGTALRAAIGVEGRRITTATQDIQPATWDRLVVLGAGKAAVAMARQASDLFGDHIAEGCVIAPLSPEEAARVNIPHIAVLPGEHPVPGQHSGASSLRVVMAAAGAAQPKTLAIVLVSGGASALLTHSIAGLPPREKARIVDALVRSGAPIGEINTVRRHLSRVKGGGLRRRLGPARVFTFAISDVPRSYPWDIGSGPTVPDPTTSAEAEVALRRHVDADLAEPAIAALRETGGETLKPSEDADWRERFHLIADNALARTAAAHSLRERGYAVFVAPEDIAGDVESAANRLVALWRAHRRDAGPYAALVAGGETQVRVGEDAGVGGRNHELALLVAKRIAPDGGHQVFFSLATDGADGNTGAAGAIVTPATLARAIEANLDADAALNAHDTGTFFAALGDQITTSSSTNTNVMDLMIFATRPEQPTP